jgi:hypothetical protein
MANPRLARESPWNHGGRRDSTLFQKLLLTRAEGSKTWPVLAARIGLETGPAVVDATGEISSNDFSLEHLMGLAFAKGYIVSVKMAA